MNYLKGTITALDKLPFSYGEFIDFVGGRTWAHFSTGLLANEENNRLAELRAYESRMSTSNRYLSDRHDFRSREYEVIYLKLYAFLTVCQMVNDYRQIAKCAFGNIDDKSFAVSIERQAQIAPSLWTARFAVVPYAKNQDKFSNIGRILAVEKSEVVRKKTSDEYALGVLLLRTFIINHRSKLTGLNSILDKLLIKIRLVVKSQPALVRRNAIENCLKETLDEKIFSLQNVFYKPNLESKFVDMNASWRPLLITGLRLVCHDCVKDVIGMDSPAINWLSIDSVISDLSDIKNDVKRSIFTGVQVKNESLPDILSELILDRQWLECSLASIRGNKLHELKEITSAGKGEVETYAHNEYMKDLRAMLDKSNCEKNKIELELIDVDSVFTKPTVTGVGKNDGSLKNTLIQKSSWLRERD